MSRFNETNKRSTRTENLAGGKAYKQSSGLELVSTLLTSFGGDTYYESGNDVTKRLEQLISTNEPYFVAKALIYARKEFGMRSITHIGASFLAKHISGKAWAKHFFDTIVHRADDMLEITAFHFSRGEKLSNAMKDGFASAICRFDEYQLAKYKGDNKKVKLVDMVNLCHPKQSSKNGDALTKLVNGELKSFDTWEVEISKAGNNLEAKKAAWLKLLNENKLGYMALLRNIRNILQLWDERCADMAFNSLQNAEAIKRSLVLPFRFSTAYNELKQYGGKALQAVSRACDISCANVPQFDGKTLVALDVSGSMSGRPSEIGSLFSAVFGKRAGDVDILTFDNNARYVSFNPDDSVLTIANSIPFNGGGTNFDSIFNLIVSQKKKYDRIIILSDMQSWVHRSWGGSSQSGFNAYRKLINSECKLYSFDLNASGTMQYPENNVYCIAGFSDKVFDIMKYLETDKKALIHTVLNYNF